MSFLHIDATQVVEILPQIRQEPAYSTWSISWLLMSRQRLSWSFDFKMESIVYHKMLSFQCVIYIRGGCVGFYRGDVRLLMEDIAELKPAVFPTVPRLLNRVYDKVSFLYTVYVCPADRWPPVPAIEPSSISSPVSGACVICSFIISGCAQPGFNSLLPSDSIWRQGSGSPLAQVTFCCLMAPTHYLNQCWLFISEIP